MEDRGDESVVHDEKEKHLPSAASQKCGEETASTSNGERAVSGEGWRRQPLVQYLTYLTLQVKTDIDKIIEDLSR